MSDSVQPLTWQPLGCAIRIVDAAAPLIEPCGAESCGQDQTSAEAPHKASSLSDFGAPSGWQVRYTVGINPDGRSATADAPLPPDGPRH